MPRYAVLLRGVNVGGRAKVPMAGLRQTLAALGCTDVKTLLQSGNAVVTFDGPPAELSSAVAGAVQHDFGVSTVAIVLDPAELAAAVEANPFPVAADDDPSHLLLVFLDRAVPAAKVGAIEPRYVADEELELGGAVLYVWYRSGIGRSKLTVDVIEKALGAKGTGRNWNTVTKLLALLQA